jgi:hypothetical protein
LTLSEDDRLPALIFFCNDTGHTGSVIDIRGEDSVGVCGGNTGYGSRGCGSRDGGLLGCCGLLRRTGCSDSESRRRRRRRGGSGTRQERSGDRHLFWCERLEERDKFITQCHF